MNRAAPFVACSAAAILALLAAGCGTPPPAASTSDAELARLAGAARKVFDAGSAEKAIPLYVQALDRARALDDARAIAPVAASLAACRLETGDLDGAARAADEAAAAALRAGSPSGGITILRGMIALARGDAKGATARAQEVRLAKGLTASLAVSAGLLQADAALASNDPLGARLTISEVRKLLAPSSSAALRAQADETEARILLAESRPIEAAEAFERAAAGRTEAGQSARVPALLGQASATYGVEGVWRAAADCAYRAGRAYAGDGRFLQARNWLQTARRLLRDRAEGADLLAAVVSLEQELAAREAAAARP